MTQLLNAEGMFSLGRVSKINANETILNGKNIKDEKRWKFKKFLRVLNFYTNFHLNDGSRVACSMS